MNIITIPKKLAQKGDLVVISRKEYDELSALKVLIKTRGAIVTDYSLNEKFRNFILMDPTQFMSQGTETPYGIQEEVLVNDN